MADPNPSPPSSSPLSQYGYSLSQRSTDEIPGGMAPWAHPSSLSSSLSPSPTSSPSPTFSPSPSLTPVPPIRSVPVLSGPYDFKIPQKKITNKSSMDRFSRSETLSLFLGFVVSLSESVKGKKLSDDCHVSDFVVSLVGLLDVMDGWISMCPPVTTAVRYGNPSFRQWQFQLQEKGPALVESVLPTELKTAHIELYLYFADSFGNSTRIDYGTGHEANFGAFLFCLTRLGLISSDDFQAVVTRVFVRYLDLMRKLQTTYWLEPAGSHGVWGLDDYHFLPFIFGASQLIGHKYMKPKSIHSDDILENFGKEYLYLSCVAFVKKVKKGPLAEHSPMLNDISGVPSWEKVHSGMLKMYRAECLEKVPIMQHFLFGSIIPWPL